MSDDLAALIRASADAEAAHAAREHPFTPAAVGRYVRDARRRRLANGAVLAVAGAIVVSGAALAVARPWAAVPPAEEPTREPTSVVSTPEESTPTPTADAMPPATPAPVVTAPAPPETTEPEEESTPPPVEEEPPPGAVTVLAIGPAGGSGEVYLSWDPVADATGYRVYRADSPDGPFVAAANYDVASGVSTDEYAGSHEYVGIYPQGGTFVYVEAVTGGLAYLQVVAFNEGGEGPRSATMCGEPQAQGLTCPT